MRKLFPANFVDVAICYLSENGLESLNFPHIFILLIQSIFLNLSYILFFFNILYFIVSKWAMFPETINKKN